MTYYINPERDSGPEVLRHRRGVIDAAVRRLEGIVPQYTVSDQAELAPVISLAERRDRVVNKIPEQRKQSNDVNELRRAVDQALGEAA